MTTTNEGIPLFDISYIPSSVVSQLPSGYTIRPLHSTDHASNFLSVLTVLTTVGSISAESFSTQFDFMRNRCPETYYTLVVCDGSNRVVGTGTVVVERKFIHALGKVGHIEDIAVEKGQQGMKLGLRIIQALDGVAERVGCYKVCALADKGHVAFRGAELI